MKDFFTLLFLMIMIGFSHAQEIGVSLSFSTTKIFSADISYRKENNRFYIGAGYQFSGQKNKVVNEREANYGLSKIKDGHYIWLVDLGYGRVFNDKLSVNSEISIGKKNYFTNYEDNRFSDGGYSLINKNENKIGFGLSTGYFLTENLEPFIGYNTIKKLNFGLRYSF